MTRCGCSGACACYLTGGTGTTVTGVGTQENPYTVSVAPLSSPAATFDNDQGLPNYANLKKRIHTWAPELSLYNGSGTALRRLRAIIARSRQGSDFGIISVIGGGVGCGQPDYADAFIYQFRDRQSSIPNRSDGFIYGHPGGADTRTGPVGTGVTNIGLCAVLSGASSGWGYTNVKPASRIDVYYYNDSHSFSFDINGSPHTVTPPGGFGISHTSVSVSLGTHDLLVHGSAGGPVYLAGAEAVDPGNGLTVTNACISNDGAPDWTSTGTRSTFMTANAASPDLYLVMLGLYDSQWNTADGVDAFRSRMNTVVNNCQATAPVMLLAPWNASPVSTAVHTTYLAALYDVADTQGVALLDLYDRLGPYSQLATSRFTTGDSFSANHAGHAEIAQALLDLI